MYSRSNYLKKFIFIKISFKFSKQKIMFLRLSLLLVCCTHLVLCKPIREFCDADGICQEQEESSYIQKPTNNTFVCLACNLALPLIETLIKENKTENIPNEVKRICKLFKIESDTVCDLVVDEYEFSVLEVIKETQIQPSDFCRFFLQCRGEPSELVSWNITLPAVPKPPVQPPQPPKPGSPTVRILQLSDIHIDFEYQPGSVADCLDPLCCRKQSTPSGRNSTGAGYWGDLRNCDIPLWTVENMFEYISMNEKFDFIYWTGDLPPHNVWNQTKNDQLKALDHLSTLFLKYFSNKIIYPALGNHEAAPCNLFPPPYVQADNIDWLYEALAKNWTATGLPSYLSNNITNGAFYTILLHPGLRLISLNMNYCAELNFWLFINTTDPLGQLEWLANVLQYSENNQEKAHIIGHINPAGCLYSWSQNYYRIVNRYENVIAAQFFGHTHTDEIELFYDFNDQTRATNIAYITPSVTTFSTLNPGYRIYTVDGFYNGSSWRVLDHETYITNITKTNLDNKPTWQLEYKAKDAYGLENLFPQDWSNLIDLALKDIDGKMARNLYNYYHKSSDSQEPCTDNCLRKFLCKFKNARSDNFIKCN
jgi:sphingomyelin phosphodiesterase